MEAAKRYAQKAMQPATSRVRKSPVMGELALIQHIRARSPRAGASVRLGIGDDCAILRARTGEDWLVTTDFSLEGRHFRRDWHSPRSIGHRTLARGLSDIAAMGGRPVAAFLSLALPRSAAADRRWLDGFLDGLLTLAALHGVTLAGGDTSESPGETVLADITVVGAAAASRALRRSSARPGDTLFCTGTLGGAAAELHALQGDPRSFQRASPSGDHPHLFPQPRLATGQALLRRRLASACIDLSDGLSTDLHHLCQASGVSAEVDAAALPLHPLARKLSPERGLQAALHGGEDYELLFTARPGNSIPLTIGGVPVTAIGRITRHAKGVSTVLLRQPTGRPTPLTPGGWEHLR